MGKTRKLCAFYFTLHLFLPLSFVPEGKSAESVKEVNLAISSLVYDPFTAKIYGASTNNLLQIDPDSGQVLRTFDLGSRIYLLELGAGNGVWVAVDHAIRRFNLETLSAEDPIAIVETASDLSPSQSEAYTVAFSTPRVPGRWEAGWLIKNGLVLPDTVMGTFVAVNGNYYFKDTIRLTPGPNGVNADPSPVPPYIVPTYHAGRMKPFGSYVYNAAKDGWNINTLEPLPGTPHFEANWAASFTISRAENAVYYLTDNSTSLDLDRFEHITFKHTGHHRFTNVTPSRIVRSIAACGTNRVAFHDSSRLYLVDTAQLFLPGDLRVSQMHPTSVLVGHDFGITITITNQGPGAAMNVSYVDTLNSGIIRSYNQQLPVDPFVHTSVVSNSFGTIEPGQSIELSLGVLPTDVLISTNQFTIISNNDPNPANNASEGRISVVRNSTAITEFPFVSADLAYDPLRKRLFISNGASLWAYHRDRDEIRLVRVEYPPDGERIEVSDAGGHVFRFALGYFYQYDSETLAGTTLPAPETATRGPITVINDFAISPSDPNLQVFSEPQGTYLFRAGSALPQRINEQGAVAFSADGSHVYFQNGSDCSLMVLRVDPSGLIPEHTRNDVPCGDFTVSGDLLYFNSGLIYKPATGQRASNSFSLTPPSYVVPRAANYIDVLNRTNGAWALRRLSATTLQPVMTIPIDPAVGTPLEMVGMDADTVAIRTSGSGARVLVVDLRNGGTLTASLTISSPNQVTISFFSVLGQNYRIERTDNLANPTWTTVRDNIPGNGGRIEETISTTTGLASFYRVVQL